MEIVPKRVLPSSWMGFFSLQHSVLRDRFVPTAGSASPDYRAARLTRALATVDGTID